MIISWLTCGAVFFGGALGALSRFLIGHYFVPMVGMQSFVWGTFIVNIIGASLMGIVGGVMVGKVFISYSANAFLVVGFLGGLTTFSAYGFELFLLLQGGKYVLAALYGGGSTFFSVLALWGGIV